MQRILSFRWLVLVSLAVYAAGTDAMAGSSVLRVGSETTVVEGPLQEDGTIDYVAALNTVDREGMTRDNNAFLALLPLLQPQEWNAAHRERLLGLLEVDATVLDGPEYIPYRSFLSSDGTATAERVVQEPWTHEEFLAAAAWVAGNEAALALVTEAVARPRYWSPIVRREEDEAFAAVLMPHLKGMRDLMHTLTARALMRVGHQDIEGAWADALTLKRLARLPGQEGHWLPLLVGISTEAASRRVVEAILSQNGLGSRQIDRMLDDLRSLPPLPGNRIIFRRRGCFEVLELVQWLNKGRSVQLDPVFAGENDPAALDEATRGLRELYTSENMDINVALKQINELYDRLAQAADPTPTALQRLATINNSEERRLERLSDLTTINEILKLPRAERRQRFSEIAAASVAHLMTAGSSSWILAERHANTAEVLEEVALAVGGYRAEHGAYPETLQALLPRWLKAVPQDPFADKGRLIVYRHEPQRVAIYSIGPNGVDDRGVKSEELGDDDIVIAWEP